MSTSTDRLADIARRHRYNFDMCLMKLNMIKHGQAGAPMIRKMLENLLRDHHYEVVGFYADCLLEDSRVSYRSLGKTFKSRVAKAPSDPPALLRLRDKIEAGMLLYKCHVTYAQPFVGRARKVADIAAWGKSPEEASQNAVEALRGSNPVISIISVEARLVAEEEENPS